MKNRITEFIDCNWDKCIRENVSDKGNIIGVPDPYTVPSVGHFDAIYYWDLYFTNLGLLCSGREQQAKYNTDNILYLVDRFGYMPNANVRTALDRSQPPFLSQMVRDVFDVFQDKTWLLEAYRILEKEYSFWMTKRMSKIGLNHYGNNEFAQKAERYADVYCERVGCKPYDDAETLARQFLATAECGWDISPRFGHCVFDYAPVDLNSLLLQMEENMFYFSRILELKKDAFWQEKAKERKRLMNRYLDRGDGFFLDYNFTKNFHSNVFSVASYFPLFSGIASKKQAEILVEELKRLEGEFGVFACEKIENEGVYQWGYPNGWPCLQYIVFSGLKRYGFFHEANRIAEKYLSLVENVFDKTGNLWEKYNVELGNIDVVNEYDMPPMMGWTAGVYLALKKELERI